MSVLPDHVAASPHTSSGGTGSRGHASNVDPGHTPTGMARILQRGSKTRQKSTSGQVLQNKLTYVAVGSVTRNPVLAQQMALDLTIPASIQFNATLDVNKENSP